MDSSQFSESAPGKLVPVTGTVGNRGFAFLPNFLPPQLDLSSRALRVALSEADRAVSQLEGIVRQIEHPEMLFSNYLRREALLSSKIEGVRSTLADLVLFEAARRGQNRDTREVAHYVEAFEYGRERCEETPIGRGFLRELHEILMRNSNPAETTPGQLRDCLVLIGERPITAARFVPPEHIFVNELLENLETYLRVDEEPPLIKIAIAHYQFETIHPFRDGNGRIGRMLISLWLQHEQILTRPVLYLSSYFERYKTEYYDALLAVSTTGSWEPWLLFFLRGVAIQSRDAARRTEQLVALRADYHQRLRGPRISQGVHDVIDSLFSFPATSIPQAAEMLGIRYPPAKEHFNKLIEAQILNEKPILIGNTNYYVAGEIIRTVEAPLNEDGNPRGSVPDPVLQA